MAKHSAPTCLRIRCRVLFDFHFVRKMLERYVLILFIKKVKTLKRCCFKVFVGTSVHKGLHIIFTFILGYVILNSK